MSNNWNPTPDVNDFIIPDEEISSTHNIHPTENTQTSNGSNNGTFPSWGTKIDLSSAFTPFTSSKNFSENNKVNERQYTGGDTLDEPILETLKRDILKIGKRLAIVIWPMQLSKLALKQQSRLIEFANSNGIQLPQSILNNRRISISDNEEENTGVDNNQLINEGTLDWDLWGPLVFSLIYSVALGLSASKKQTNLVFSGSFSFIWLFFIIIGLNIQLLGGSISFMSAISAAGYSMFPIVIGELICSLLLKWKLLRLGLITFLNVWSIYAGIMSLKCSGVLPGRVFLAIYPVGLMYSVLSWLAVIT